jgi:hypothetical protein
MMQHQSNDLGQPVGFPLPQWTPPEPPAREPMEGRFCRLEPLSLSLHAASLHAANQLDVQGRMWTYLPYGPFHTLESYHAWTEEAGRSSDPLFYAIVNLADDRTLGVGS